MKFSECNFRNLYKQYILINQDYVFNGAVDVLLKQEYTSPLSMNAALCFCYIDPEAGMSFHFLCLANFESGEVDIESYNKMINGESVLLFRANPDFNLKFYTGEISHFTSRTEMIDKCYHHDEGVLPTRNITSIDNIRNAIFPDDILVFLIKDGLEPERPWVRLKKIEDGKICGILLNEPFKEFGVHANEYVKLDVLLRDDEDIVILNANNINTQKEKFSN